MKNSFTLPLSMMKNFIIFQYINFSYHKMQVSACYKCAPTFLTTTKSFTPIFSSRSRQCRTLFFIQNSIHCIYYKYRYDRRAEDKNFPVFDFTSFYFLVCSQKYIFFPYIQHKIYTHLMRNEGSKKE